MSYQVTAEKTGFRKVVLTELTIEVQDALSRNFTLQVGPVSETVLVVSANDQVDVSPARWWTNNLSRKVCIERALFKIL